MLKLINLFSGQDLQKNQTFSAEINNEILVGFITTEFKSMIDTERVIGPDPQVVFNGTMRVYTIGVSSPSYQKHPESRALAGKDQESLEIKKWYIVSYILPTIIDSDPENEVYFPVSQMNLCPFSPRHQLFQSEKWMDTDIEWSFQQRKKPLKIYPTCK